MISIAYINKVAFAAWSSWLEELSPLWKGKRNADFDRTMNVYGFLPDVGDVSNDRLILRRDDYAFGAVPAAYRDGDIASLNANSSWLPMPSWCGAALNGLKDPVAEILGCPWRVLNVRSWVTRPGASGGPFAWHTDGLPKEMLKIMIYSTPCDKEHGGLAVDIGGGETQRLQGQAGLWVLFYNSKLKHCGIPPTLGERVATEITLVPWDHFILEPISLGTNGQYPIYPLMRGDECLTTVG